ncbi:MAG: dihydrofolate reductase family protein, partial [Gaiellaceae bacterium]
TVVSFDEWPYQKPVVVMSKSLTEADVPDELESKVRLTRLDPAELMQELSEEGWERAYVDGGRIVQSFLRAGLIAELVLTSVPVLIGSGIRLFGELRDDVHLELVSSESFESGVVQSHYRILERASPEPG